MKEMDKHYSWGTAKCVRYGEDFSEESHPCYWCGIPPKDMLGEDIVWCEKCGGFQCPNCGRCWCNVPENEFKALQELRNKYCCNWFNFKAGFDLIDCNDLFLLDLVPGFQKALDYCRTKKGFKKE